LKVLTIRFKHPSSYSQAIGPAEDNVIEQIDLEAVRWHLRTPVARDLVWEEFQLPNV
jgi:hypothetical protein